MRSLFTLTVALVLGVNAFGEDLIELEAAPPADSRAHSLVFADWDWEAAEDATPMSDSIAATLGGWDDLEFSPPYADSLRAPVRFEAWFLEQAQPVTRRVFNKQAAAENVVFTFHGFMR